MFTGWEERDAFFLSRDMIDASENALVSFTSTSIVPAADGFTVTGNLDLHGMQKSITFPAQIEEHDRRRALPGQAGARLAQPHRDPPPHVPDRLLVHGMGAVQHEQVPIPPRLLDVLDEADRMADMGFMPSVKRLLDRTPGDRRTVLFSATARLAAWAMRLLPPTMKSSKV